jgi:thiamine biosynthesis lipoprotein
MQPLSKCWKIWVLKLKISSWMTLADSFIGQQSSTQKRIAVLLLCVFGFMAVSCSSSAPDERQETLLQGLTMGTSFTVKIVNSGVGKGSLRQSINELLAGINDSMSTYLPDSELSRFNRQQSTEWVSVSDELLTVLRLAKKVSEETQGAFDITVGPVVNLWGFGPDKNRLERPEQAKISNLMKQVGYKKLLIDKENRRIKKQEATLYVDLSAIAKGYAVDEISRYLEKIGQYDYLVEVGGELRVNGKNKENQLWRIAVEKPLVGERAVQKVIALENEAIATSGDYRNYFEADGVRYSHTINPRTGEPITNRLGSVSVISSSSAYSDAMATALMVLGADKGLALAEKLELKVLFLVKQKEGFSVIKSSTFPSINMN